MKQILVILSFLLLSSPLFGQSQETNVLYRWKTSSGFQWKTFGNGEVKPKYVGEITNGEPDGNGTLTYSNGDKYEGEWKDGEPNGQGTFTFNGMKYVGEFKDGEVDGQGTYISHDGRKYEGEWKDGREWNGTVYDKNGNITGKYVNGILQEHSLKPTNKL